MNVLKLNLSVRRRAFTLVELITVITIILILVAVMLPTVSSLMRGNNQKQSLNTISAYLASARATALNYKVPAGVVFYEDPSNKNATALVLVMQDPTVLSTTVLVLKPVSARGQVDFLPVGIKVATLGGANNLTVDSSITTAGITAGRVVLFDGNGQLTLRALISGGTNTTWNLDTTSTGVVAVASGVSSPAVVVYDSNQLNGYLQANGQTGAAAATTWLSRYADTIVINSYTGNVIR